MSHTAAPTIAPSPTPIHPGSYPSDEQILGITDDAALTNAADNASSSDSSQDEAILSGAGRSGRSEGSAFSGRADASPSPRSFDAQNPPQDDNDQVDAGGAQSTALAADLPDWLARASAAAPEAAPQLATLWQRANALDTFDRAYYGTDAGAQQALVAQLYADDPAALRAMVAAAQQIIDGQANGNRANDARANAAPQSANAPASRAANRAPGAQTTAAAAFDPAAYAQFEHSTNDAVVADVNRAIERALDRALPGNIADGARRRIAGDTLAEVHAALRGDRELAAQVAESLRSGHFTAATRDAVARLIATRARGVVPEAARRVIGEWTGSVLASHRDRAAKTQAASARVDVTGGALPQPVPRRAVAPRDIDYRATSDEDILSW